MHDPDKTNARALPLVRINSLEELFAHEKEILRRINEAPNGPKLFVVHPLRMLTDIRIELSDEARRSLIRHEPGLAALSTAPYEGLKETHSRQLVRFHIKGLFRR